MTDVRIGFKLYRDLESRPLYNLENLLKLAQQQLQHHLDANVTIPAKRYPVFKYYHSQLEKKIAVVQAAIDRRREMLTQE